MAAASSHNTSSMRGVRLAPLSPTLALPAYAALFVATGIAGYVLAYHIDTVAFRVSFGLALVLAILATFGANHGNETVRFTSQWVRFVTVPVLLAISIVTTPEIFLSGEFASDANTIIASYIGLIMTGCIVLIGLRVEGRPVPISMPLVATLSLFALLNLVIVDTIVQVGFLIFVAASLFLIGYERLLSHWQKREVSRLDEATGNPQLQNAARSFLAASAAWFTIFVASAALLYQPLFAILPGILPTPIGRLSRTQAQTDWRHSPRQVEVRGGTHTLSEREVMKVTMINGQSEGLWRGRVYQNYAASSWRDDARELRNQNIGFRQMKPLKLYENLPPVDERLGRVQQVEAEVEPLFGSPAILYGAGRITAMNASWTNVSVNPRTSAVSLLYPPFNYTTDAAYRIRSEYVQPLLPAALRARGLSAAEVQAWKDNLDTAPTLLLPDDPLISQPIKQVAREITSIARAQNRPLDTPQQKLLAIRSYLHENCVYSLSAPLAPSTEDGVAYFLTTSKEGACDMFASAMTLLLREFNVPSRMVTGFLQPENTDNPDSNEIIFRERDAHAWVEYWVPQLGWVSHDPSSGTRLADDGMMQGVTQWLSSTLRRMGGMTALLPLIGVLLLAAGLFWPQLEKMIGKTAVINDPQAQQRARVSRTYIQAARLLSRHLPARRKYGLAPFTPRELDDAISQTNIPPAARQEFAALTYLHNAARYAPTPPDVTEAQLNESLERLKQALLQRH